jgi:predicted AAA+ superfamily ATPase
VRAVNPNNINAHNPSPLTEYGHLLESFVVGELLKQASWCSNVAEYGHFRTLDGEEVDHVIENDDGGIVSFEIKAGGRFPGLN